MALHFLHSSAPTAGAETSVRRSSNLGDLPCPQQPGAPLPGLYRQWSRWRREGDFSEKGFPAPERNQTMAGDKEVALCATSLYSEGEKKEA